MRWNIIANLMKERNFKILVEIGTRHGDVVWILEYPKI